MTPTIVTGFIPLPGHPKSDRYLELGQRLLDLGLPTDAYIDPAVSDKLTIRAGTRLLAAPYHACWAYPLIESHKPVLPPTNNPTKDTAAFHAVQLQKSRWLAMSACGEASTYIWIDFGILHVPGITESRILELYDKLCDVELSHIGMPSIWPLAADSLIPYERPNWFCAGGLLVMPDYLAGWFDAMVTTRTEEYLAATNKLTWEVNVWASIMREHPMLFHAWQCDHNATMFTGYKGE